MDILFKMAEEEMLELHHPYVGTEHLFLAYLKMFDNQYITYDKFKNNIIKVIGQSYKRSEVILYTPILRKIKNESSNIYEAIISILTDDNCIAYNLLLVNGYDIEKIYLDILKNDKLREYEW